jgi:hypothetical protein
VTGGKWNESTIQTKIWEENYEEMKKIAQRLKYLIKIERVWRGIASRPEQAVQMAIIQTKIWEKNSGIYEEIWKIASDVMSKQDTYVKRAVRGPYHAAVREYYKEVVVNRMDPDVMRKYMENKYPNIDFRIFDAILKALEYRLNINFQK